MDTTDQSILHALQREVLEETGLVVTGVLKLVNTLEFDGRKGTKWRKLTFLANVEAVQETMPTVCLNDDEHVDAVWVSKQDIVDGEAHQNRRIEFAYEAQKQTVLEVLGRFQAQ